MPNLLFNLASPFLGRLQGIAIAAVLLTAYSGFCAYQGHKLAATSYKATIKELNTTHKAEIDARDEAMKKLVSDIREKERIFNAEVENARIAAELWSAAHDSDNRLQRCPKGDIYCRER